jgi:hypothetical protein
LWLLAADTSVDRSMVFGGGASDVAEGQVVSFLVTPATLLR